MKEHDAGYMVFFVIIVGLLILMYRIDAARIKFIEENEVLSTRIEELEKQIEDLEDEADRRIEYIGDLEEMLEEYEK